MIDLHTHSFFSDGELIPSELVRRAAENGYQAIAITDHVDLSNIDFIIPRIVKVCQQLQKQETIRVIPGIELTHVPPACIADLVKEGRSLGAKIIVVHGETIVEPVAAGTNRAAVMSDIDILAHPGLVSEDVARLAAEKGIYFEITTRRGHSLANGHVAHCSRKYGVPLILNTDTHSPENLISKTFARQIALGAALTDEEADIMFSNSERLVGKITSL